MSKFFLPTKNPESWKAGLADPDKQWRTGFSARALAHCWESSNGFPPEISQLFATSGAAAFRQTEFLMAFPEYKVPLLGKGYPSQNDIFALAKAADGQLISITVEGKVAEPFGGRLVRAVRTYQS